MNHAFSSCFIVIYHRFCILWEETVCFEIVLKTKYMFLVFGKWGSTSVVKNSTADGEVGGKYNG